MFGYALPVDTSALFNALKAKGLPVTSVREENRLDPFGSYLVVTYEITEYDKYGHAKPLTIACRISAQELSSVPPSTIVDYQEGLLYKEIAKYREEEVQKMSTIYPNYGQGTTYGTGTISWTPYIQTTGTGGYIQPARPFDFTGTDFIQTTPYDTSEIYKFDRLKQQFLKKQLEEQKAQIAKMEEDAAIASIIDALANREKRNAS